MASKVYFASLKSDDQKCRTEALQRLLDALKEHMSFKKKEFVPVKITLGDSQCVYNIAPLFVKMIVGQIRMQGAKPFLFDTSVIYEGQRQNAIDHLALAEKKGFSFSKTGAPFIVADGLFGQDGKEFTVNYGHIARIKVPSFVGMLDSLVVISHLTGHVVSGFAATIKNVAMGMSCRPTKQVQHSSIKPSVKEKKCTACGCCINICPVKAIILVNQKAFINQDICIGCAECLCACKFDAITINWKEEPFVFCQRMVEVAGFILKNFKRKLFFNFVWDVTKECDCISTERDEKLTSDLGVLASEDILSLDKATADLALKHRLTDYLDNSYKLYSATFEYAHQQGLGSLDYELVEL